MFYYIKREKTRKVFELCVKHELVLITIMSENCSKGTTLDGGAKNMYTRKNKWQSVDGVSNF